MRIRVSGTSEIESEEDHRPTWARIDLGRQQIGDQAFATDSALVLPSGPRL
jgi:hypothetical protein